MIMAGRIAARTDTQSPLYVPGESDTRILTAVTTFHVMTAQQVLRYLRTGQSLTDVQTRLKRLWENGFLLRRDLGRVAVGGSTALVYTASTKGRNFAAALGVAVGPRFRPTDFLSKSLSHLRHDVATTELYVAAVRFCREEPRLAVDRLMLERQFRAAKSSVELAGKRRLVYPDGWLLLTGKSPTGQRVSIPLLLEVDMGTERQDAWREKVRTLVSWLDHGYEQVVHERSATVLIVAVPGQSRGQSLLAWTEAELTAYGRRNASALFCIAPLNPATVAPRELFLSSLCMTPFRAERVPLLPADLPLEVARG
jgi:hypothetical protein